MNYKEIASTEELMFICLTVYPFLHNCQWRPAELVNPSTARVNVEVPEVVLTFEPVDKIL